MFLALETKARFSERADTIGDDEDARSGEEGQDHAAEPCASLGVSSFALKSVADAFR